MLGTVIEMAKYHKYFIGLPLGGLENDNLVLFFKLYLSVFAPSGGENGSLKA